MRFYTTNINFKYPVLICIVFEPCHLCYSAVTCTYKKICGHVFLQSQ